MNSMNRFNVNRNNFQFLIKKLESLLDEAPVWTISWAQPKDKRSDKQNRLLWEFCTDFAEFCGYEKREVEQFKAMITLEVYPTIMTAPTGNIVTMPPSTSKMDTKEFTDMMDALIRYAAEVGFVWSARE
jgi:hypothetical protein